ncbi:unnamed protein product, partial [Adineta steineri]
MTKAILFVLLLISIYRINASIPLSTLKSDAKELTSIFKEFINIPTFGNFIKRYGANICNYMKKCCPGLRSDFSSLVGNFTFESECSRHENFMAKGSRGVQCLMIKNEYYQMKRNPIVNQSAPLFSNDEQTVAYDSLVSTTYRKVCSQIEVEHYTCTTDDLSTHQSCNLKVLQKVSEDYGT